MALEKHVLLVDDELEVVTFMSKFLKRFKLTSTSALSGEEALSAFDRLKGKIDFVFLDINMPGLDGIGVLEEIRKRDPDAKVLIITGATDQQHFEKAKKLGALDYILKPLDLGDLKAKIDKYILAN